MKRALVRARMSQLHQQRRRKGDRALVERTARELLEGLDTADRARLWRKVTGLFASKPRPEPGRRASGATGVR